jgi:hypothetical protein
VLEAATSEADLPRRLEDAYFGRQYAEMTSPAPIV